MLLLQVEKVGVSLLYTMGKCPRFHLVKPDEVEITTAVIADVGVQVTLSLKHGVEQSILVEEQQLDILYY